MWYLHPESDERKSCVKFRFSILGAQALTSTTDLVGAMSLQETFSSIRVVNLPIMDQLTGFTVLTQFCHSLLFCFSWDRQPFITTVRTGKPDSQMAWRHVERNIVVANYGGSKEV